MAKAHSVQIQGPTRQRNWPATDSLAVERNVSIGEISLWLGMQGFDQGRSVDYSISRVCNHD
jgi:hypothetical protein